MSELISELIEEKAALIAERDALKARVAELESVIRADIAHISTLADDVKALAQPVTDEDVEHAVMRVSGIDPTAIGWRQTYAARSPTKDTMRAALETFLANRRIK